MKITTSLVVFFLLAMATYSNNGTTLSMLYHKDKLILQVNTVQNETLHFIFDTGSPDILLDSAIAAKYQLINNKGYNTVMPFAKGIYLEGQTFLNNGFFADTFLNTVFPEGTAVNMSLLNIPSDIKIDGFIGLSKPLAKYTLLLNFINNTLTIGDSTIVYNSNPINQSVNMMYSDEGHETAISKYGRTVLSNKIKVCYKPGQCIETHLLFDTGCHWESVILTTLGIDSIFTQIDIPGKTKQPTKYLDKKESIYYWVADSFVIANTITHKKVKTVYMKTFSLRSFGSLNTYILIGAPFFKHYQKVYFNFPAKRIDFVN